MGGFLQEVTHQVSNTPPSVNLHYYYPKLTSILTP